MKNLINFLCAAVLFAGLFAHAAPAQATDMTSGTSVTDTIPVRNPPPGNPFAASTQTFTGTAGEGILLYLDATVPAYIAVDKPDGTSWFHNNGPRFSGTLPVTGTYTVKISTVLYNVSGGSYSLAYLRGASSVSDGSLTSGTSYNGTLAVNGIESFQFTGTTGERVQLSTYAAYNTYISLYKPDGSYWTYDVNHLVPLALPATGTYTAVVVGGTTANSGSYRVDFLRAGAANGVSDGLITSGTSYNGTLAGNGIESFHFDGVSGQGILLYTGAAYANIITVYKPDGSLLTYDIDRLSYTLTVTGRYTIAVKGYYYASSGSYRLDFVEGGQDVSEGSLVTTLTRPGTLLANGLNSYQFSGTASTSITVASTGAYTRVLTIYKPNGGLWTYNTNAISGTLPVGSTGVYTLVVSG